MVSFTGSTRAGKRVMALAAETVKRVSLELGGKSANVILEDADLAKAVPDGVFNCYLNSGQTCSALTRMLVPRARLAEVEGLRGRPRPRLRPGRPDHGVVASSARSSSEIQRERVRDYITTGIDEGARLVCGGAEAPEGLDKGYFVAPTVFSDVTNDMTIAREEIFGPVLSIIPYDTEDEAVDIANDSALRAGRRRLGRERRGARFESPGACAPARSRSTAGRATTSRPSAASSSPGTGRELGRYGFEEFLEVKAVQHT